MLHNCYIRSEKKFSEINLIFKLCQINGLIFLASSLIIGLKQHFGSPIDCIYDGILVQQKSFVNSFCWENYIPITPQKTSISSPYAAVNKELQVFSSNIYSKKQSTYNQWLSLVLMFQAILSLIPTWLWNSWKDNRLYETILNIKEPNKQPSRRKLLIMNLANDLCNDVFERRYAKLFILCELLNIVFLIFNVVVTNCLFQQRFIAYGIVEIGRGGKIRNLEDSFDSELFPLFAKCTVQMVMKGSNKVKEEATCVVSFNSLCKSVFAFLWVWLLILSLLSIVGIIYRVFMMISRRRQRNLLMEMVDTSFEEKLITICKNLGFYSWFVVYRISRNVDPLTFQDIIASLMARLDNLSVYKTTKTSLTCRERARRDSLSNPVIQLSTIV